MGNFVTWILRYQVAREGRVGGPRGEDLTYEEEKGKGNGRHS